MAKIILMCLLSMLACASAQRITTIHLDGVQYFISRMNPYSPELNYFLAYQYCRSLGLQLASFETKEKAESMTTYLKNAGYGNYDFWTSGNRLGTGMFLWMSTGLPFNATFDLFENSADALQASMLDANDHNSNTAPQRTARDSSSGSEKGCVILKQPSLKWMPEDCSAVKDFICEQTRCYYYNYGSIPVSSAQGRPITSTTPQPQQQQFTTSPAKAAHFTTPLPVLLSTHATEKKFTLSNQQIIKPQQQQQLVGAKPQHNTDEDESQPSFMSLNLNQDSQDKQQKLENEDETDEIDDSSVQDADDSKGHSREFKKPDNLNAQSLNNKDEESSAAAEHNQSLDTLATDDQEEEEEENVASEVEPTENALKFIDNKSSSDNSPEVDERVKQISHKIESIVNGKEQQQKITYQHPTQKHFNREEHNERDDDDLNRQSFLSLTDLIRTLRPHDKQIIPQIDSDYSNAMRVLGENTGPLIKNNDNEQQRGGLNFRDM